MVKILISTTGVIGEFIVYGGPGDSSGRPGALESSQIEVIMYDNAWVVPNSVAYTQTVISSVPGVPHVSSTPGMPHAPDLPRVPVVSHLPHAPDFPRVPGAPCGPDTLGLSHGPGVPDLPHGPLATGLPNKQQYTESAQYILDYYITGT